MSHIFAIYIDKFIVTSNYYCKDSNLKCVSCKWMIRIDNAESNEFD
jgi:hypothetical protein